MAAVECAQRRQASTAASAPVDARTRSATGGFFDVFHARGLHAVGITFPDGIVYRLISATLFLRRPFEVTNVSRRSVMRRPRRSTSPPSPIATPARKPAPRPPLA